MKSKGIKRLATCSEVSVIGSREVLAGGVRAICEYTENSVSLKLCDTVLTVRGEGLTMRNYYGGAVCVCGEIRGLDFER